MHDLDFVVVKSNGIRLKLAMAGDGPLVIFSHGWQELSGGILPALAIGRWLME